MTERIELLCRVAIILCGCGLVALAGWLIAGSL